VKGKQFSVKVYETTIEDENAFMTFFDTHHTLFKDHLISINGDMSPKIKTYLKENSFRYIHNIDIPRSRTRKEIEKEIEIQKDKTELEIDKLSKKLQNNLTVLDNIIRSGVEIDIDGDLLLLNRVNSGATIKTRGNLIVTDIVDGDIRCNGSFMMITKSPKANIIFNSVFVENKQLEFKLNKIELINHRIVVSPVLQRN